MIGTDREMLFLLTRTRDWYARLSIDITKDMAMDIKLRISDGSIGKQRMKDLLTAFGCVMIRDEIVMDALWRNDEIEGSEKYVCSWVMRKRMWYVPLGFGQRQAKDFKLNLKKNLVSKDVRRHILSTLGYEMFKDEVILPAIWEKRPLFTRAAVDTLGKGLDRCIYSPEEEALYR